MKQRKLQHLDMALQSPPARGRGLKRVGYRDLRKLRRSPPARGRGLKLTLLELGFQLNGRPPRGGVD